MSRHKVKPTTLQHGLHRDLPFGSNESQLNASILADRSAFYTDYWIPLLKDTYGFGTIPELQSSPTLPIVEVSSKFTGSRGVSLPFFDFCYAQTGDNSKLESIRSEFIDFGKRANWKYLESRGAFPITEKHPSSIRFYNHLIDLQTDSDTQFRTLKSHCQRAIRKAKKSGVTVSASHSAEHLSNFYELQCSTRRRHGLPPQPKKFFEALRQQLLKNEKGVILIASLEGTPVAGSIYLRQDPTTIHYKYGASDLRFQKYRGNNILMWHATRYFAEKGYRLIDLGRNSINSQEGLRQYKLAWNAKEKIEHYQRFDLQNNTIVQMKDNAFGIHNKIFSKLPTSVNKLLGNLIYKHIA